MHVGLPLVCAMIAASYPPSCFLERFGVAPVAQLDRVLGYEPRGRGFESCRARQNSKGSPDGDPFFRLKLGL